MTTLPAEKRFPRVEPSLLQRAHAALLEVLHERDAGLLVFGPDLGLTSRRRFRSAARRVRQQADCLVWVAPDG